MEIIPSTKKTVVWPPASTAMKIASKSENHPFQVPTYSETVAADKTNMLKNSETAHYGKTGGSQASKDSDPAKSALRTTFSNQWNQQSVLYKLVNISVAVMVPAVITVTAVLAWYIVKNDNTISELRASINDLYRKTDTSSSDAQGATTAATSTTTCTTNCPDGWTRFDDGCIKIIYHNHSDFSLLQAVKTCAGMGAVLTEIETVEEFDFLNEQSTAENVHLWIGATNFYGEWLWLSGKALDMTVLVWGTDEPGNEDTENCVGIFHWAGVNSMWNYVCDGDSYSNLPVCKIKFCTDQCLCG